MGEAPLRLWIVGEDALARAGLRVAAEAAGLFVQGEGAPEDTASEVRGDEPDETPDVVIWDLGASPLSFEPLRGVAARRAVVAVLWGEEQAREALAAGARGLLRRERIEERLGAAVRAAADGLIVLGDELADAVLRPRAGTPPDLVEPLTPREQEVLQLVAEGLTNRRIGERLGISEHTAKFHVNAILGKLEARTRVEAVAQATRLGLLLL